jgi:hypothetical protein
VLTLLAGRMEERKNEPREGREERKKGRREV